MDTKFTFDDIILIPQYSEIEYHIGPEATKTELFGMPMNVPILSAAMDSITGREMMEELYSVGTFGVHHRYCSEDTLMDIAAFVPGGIGIAPSMGPDFVEKLWNIAGGENIFFKLDVAHGDTKKCLDFCEELVKRGIKNIISGNLVTPGAVERYLKIDVDHFTVGIGSGAACTTRIVTGFGLPQASALMEIRREFPFNGKLISDGGHNTTGDIVKAFVCGADYVMLGKMLSGCRQNPMPGVYRGMASADALSTRKKEFFVEGATMEVETDKDVKEVIKQIGDAIQTACFYGGVEHYSELEDVEWELITQNSVLEGGVRK